MTFLKRFGQIVATVAKIVTGIGPLLPAATGNQKVSDTIENIASIILTTEALGQTLGTKGEDKLRAAAPLIAQIILRSDLMVGKKIDNPTLFHEGCTNLADGMAKILNSVKADSLKAEDIPK